MTLAVFLTELLCPYIHSEIAIMLYTGIRVGELTGLEWKDVNFTTGELSIKE